MPVGPWGSTGHGCPECEGRALGFDGAVALGPYQDSLRALCLHLKNERHAWLVPWLTDLLLEKQGDVLRGRGGDLVVPVPLHWTRRVHRGYDQAQTIAAALARRMGLPASRPIRRSRRTPPLAGLGRAARAEILGNVFQIRPRVDVKGRTILLVDDILTTGATCGAAARVLKKAGAKRVHAVVLGRAEGRA
jgi:ComF family protein